MKKKLLTISLIVICLAILSGGTLAFYTTDAITHNVITTGGVDIELVEEMIDEEGRLVPFRDQVGIMPTDHASKIVSVKNNDEDAWIRVRVKKEIILADGSKELVPLDVQNAQTKELISLDIDWNNWILRDNYYYYKKPLSTGAKTPSLFTEVVFDGAAMGNAYGDCQVLIDIQAQAVQYANNPKGGGSVLDAQGWPIVPDLISNIFG